MKTYSKDSGSNSSKTSTGKITAFDNDNIYSQEAGLSGLTPENVSAMQSTLGVPVDGKFGANTYSALAQAQYAYGQPSVQPISYANSVEDNYNYGGMTPSDIAGTTVPSVGETQSQGSMLGNLFSNSDGFYYHDASNMPAGLSPQAQAEWLKSPSALSQTLGNIGSGVSALGGIYDMYNAYQSNKRAEDAYKMQKAEIARQVQKDKDFSANINKSGLGTRA